MTVDFRLISGDAGGVCFDSRRNWGSSPEPDSYSICFYLDGKFMIFRETPNEGVDLADGLTTKLNTGAVPNHLKMVARGSQMAFFLNNEPLELVNDNMAKSGAFGFWIESDNSTPLEIRYDNLKVWNTASLFLKVTSTTSADQIHAFADPILIAINGRSPDVADDFSDPNSGWPNGTTSEGEKWGYIDGTYSIILTNLYRNSNGDPCLDISSARQPQFSDFVLEWDAQFVTGIDGNWHSIFRDMQLTQQGGGRISFTANYNTDDTFFLGLSTNVGLNSIIPPFLKGTGINHVAIIAQGTNMAVYINGAPLVLANDPNWQFGRISLNFGVCNNANQPLQARFDNLKAWNIAFLP
jgi:hypothetical protein